MNRETFTTLCNKLGPHLRKQVTRSRGPIATDEQEQTIWRLATNIKYRTIAAMFGVGISTVCTIVLQTTHVITEHLLPRYVCIPNEERLKEIIKDFENLWGLPQAVGTIDGSHIPILKPTDSLSDSFNRKGYYQCTGLGQLLILPPC